MLAVLGLVLGLALAVLVLALELFLLVLVLVPVPVSALESGHALPLIEVWPRTIALRSGWWRREEARS